MLASVMPTWAARSFDSTPRLAITSASFTRMGTAGDYTNSEFSWLRRLVSVSSAANSQVPPAHNTPNT